MKNIIAYSLWGNHPMYWIGAKRNIELAKKYYPGFVCRFYIDSTCDKNLIDSLTDCEKVIVNSKDSFHGMFWRFWAADDPEVDVFLSRDCDSRFSNREKCAVDEWLASDKDFHTMRDHPYHTVPILGGMWGCRNGLIRKLGITKMIENWNFYSRKGSDQDFLGQVVYPLVKNTCFEHSEFNLRYGNQTSTFPTIRENYEFVGDVFDENDNRHPDYWVLIKNKIG